MKRIEEILDFERPVSDIISDLKVKYVNVPDWSKLQMEYDPKKHPIYTDAAYRDDEAHGNKLCRISCAWQKLATKRMSELVFATKVKRVWNAETDEQKRAVNVLEGIFNKNRIDFVNLERARYLYGACEFATIWYNREGKTTYGGEKSYQKIRCKTFTPMNGDAIYPLFDDFDDLIALSISYKRTVGKVTTEYFEVYTDSMHMRWRQEENNGWTEDMAVENVAIGKIAGVYAYRKEPIWEDQSDNVYEMEWMLSRNANYLKKNSTPLFKIFADASDLADFRHENKGEDDKHSRKILYLPKDAKAEYETWVQGDSTLKFQSETMIRLFHMQTQLPDMSFDNMKSTPMSGEARKMMFIDAQLKVVDESGLWIDTLFRECSVVKELAKLAVTELAGAIDSLELVDVVITPYMPGDENETITNLTAANGGKPLISQRTAMAKYGVDNIDEELQKINEESALALEETVF